MDECRMSVERIIDESRERYRMFKDLELNERMILRIHVDL